MTIDRSQQAVDDWTADERGVSNMSAKYTKIVAAVERLIRDDAHMLIGGRADSTARLIVSNLAHRFGMAPKETQPPVISSLSAQGDRPVSDK